ncbi:MAG: hypothetical protein RI925_839 [Pseudomonadota bacterium]|jgi:peptidoglycan/LPS O-acetylase OafA/YrhL
MRQTPTAMPLVDALKAFACLTIVIHHLCFYGPLTDAVRPWLPGLIGFFDVYGRMAVQVFLVVSGFLLAHKYLPTPLVAIPLRAALQQRYARLAAPYCAALLLAVACTALARQWMSHPSLSAPPEGAQLLAHVLLLQDLLDVEALSAGVWYVAIDFQLCALALGLLWLARRLGAPDGGVTLLWAMTLLSMFYFNLDPSWDETAFYFFAAFGLGMLGAWAARHRHGLLWLAVLTACTGAALAVQFRPRLALALAVMLLLAWGHRQGFLHTLPVPTAVTRLSQVSYPVFLVHFPLSLLMNAIGVTLFADSLLGQGLWALTAVAVSVAGGTAFDHVLNVLRRAGRLHALAPASALATAMWLSLTD